MPATEETYRNQRLLHVVFAVSGLALLGSTVWMFAADHNREWKQTQSTFRDAEVKLTQMREFQYLTDEVTSKTEQLKGELRTLKSLAPDASLVAGFQGELSRYQQEQEGKNRKAQPVDFDHVTALYDELNQASADAAEKRNALGGESDAAPGPDGGESEAVEVDDAKQAEAIAAEQVAGEIRGKLVRALNEIVDGAKDREKEFLRQRKFKSGEYDAAKANVLLQVRDSKGDAVVAEYQEKAEKVKEVLNQLNDVYEDGRLHREALRDTVAAITADVDAKEAELKAHGDGLEVLKSAGAERDSLYWRGFGDSAWPLGKKWLELPILDAFNSPLKIHQIWLPELLQDYNFKGVARFDRCVTCHQGIDKPMAGAPRKPAYEPSMQITISLPSPAAKPDSNLTLENVYGIRLASAGLIDKSDVTVSFVAPKSLGALATVDDGTKSDEEEGIALREAAASPHDVSPAKTDNGLKVGDVIEYVNGNKVLETDEARRFLMETAEWGEPITIQVRRGLPQPFVSHPRLDLFVGSTSPHKMQEMGCTICHEGQGSATAFKWVSHTPNDEDQREDWMREHGWFNNHHWIFPMFPKRFAESTCLKCHHDVTELEPSERYPEPPAPKLLAGHKLIQTYGCFGCHEVNGFDGPDARVGPDLRLEPNYYGAALHLTATLPDRIAYFEKLKAEADDAAAIDARLGELTEIAELAAKVGADQEHEIVARRRILEIAAEDAAREDSLGPTLDKELNKTVAVLKDSETPGSLRKPGPSLRYVSSKLDGQFLYDWIQQPKRFREETRMPQFFGLWDHLDGKEKDKGAKFEPIEVRGITAYLMDRSQPFDPVAAFDGIKESSAEEKVARGKLLFETRGCLACHSHGDFPKAHDSHSTLMHATHGPDLSNIGDKLDVERNPRARDWLYSWVRNPSHYHVRTKMPDTFLLPVEQPKDDDAEADSGPPEMTDPADDITEYLLASRAGWKPVTEADSKVDTAALDELVLEHLSGAFFAKDAEKFLVQGIPESRRAGLKGAEAELVGDASTDAKLLYVGRKAIAKYGCSGCHDIPGFEDSKPIGTGLADWGRKDPSKLDFGHVLHYLHEGHGEHGGHDEHHEHDEHDAHDDDGHDDEDQLDPFYEQYMMEHGRPGFIMQKLREPRSYDYKATQNKKYNERLRMPMFPFDDEQREAIITFVLGLVAEPPAAQYVYQSDPRRKAIVEGRQVLEKYNCGGCHVLEAERWDVAYRGKEFRKPSSVKEYPFMLDQFTSDQLAASDQTDRRNLKHATLVGVPALNEADGLPVVMDDEGDAIEDDEPYDPESLQYRFDLWEPTLLNGKIYGVGVQSIMVPNSVIEAKHPANGGDLTDYLLPRITKDGVGDDALFEELLGAIAKGTEARGWLPPPLLGQGAKVQADWLHDFLLDPHEIRPAAILRMPKFNMSSEEATKLVNYFAAVDNAQYPYEFAARSRGDHLAEADAAYRTKLVELGVEDPGPGARLGDAMKIVQDNTYCVKCHRIGNPENGGFEPDGNDRAKAPDLANVHKRLREGYLRRWIASPKRILPYTTMPRNVNYDPDLPDQGTTVKQDLYHGNSTEQVDALVDLWMNYDVYTDSQLEIKVSKPPAAEEAPANGASE